MSDHDDDAQVQALVSEELEAAKKMAVEPAPEVTVDEDLQSIRIVDPQLHTASHEENLYKWDDIVGVVPTNTTVGQILKTLDLAIDIMKQATCFHSSVFLACIV